MTKKKNEIIILGSGTSTGIPMLGCSCDVCHSSNPKNQRLRTSVLIKSANDINILIDTSVDLRRQFLDNNISRVDLAFITHDHADHTHGIDDLRPLCFGPPVNEIPLYSYPECVEKLETKFPYIFKTHEVFSEKRPPLGGGIPKLSLKSIDVTKKLTLQGEEFEFLLLPHGHTSTLGIVHGGLAYITDCQELSPEHIENLKSRNLELLIIDCVTDEDHETHLSLDQAFDYIERISPKKAGLIHMGHALEHSSLERAAKERFSIPVFPTFDTQRIEY